MGQSSETLQPVILALKNIDFTHFSLYYVWRIFKAYVKYG